MNPSNAATLVTAGIDRRTPSLATRLFRAYEWVSHRETLACVTVLFLTLGIRAALLPWYPVPLPAVHDEFSYLLAGDTFASGRVANPPHPMWQHFETFHELMQPTYASKYPALQGLVLAFGQKFFGQPWIGVYLSSGVMCAAICWMLQGWLTPNLGLLGGLLFMLRIGVFGYWMNSYWGGSVAAIGGALALGSLVRIWRRQQTVHWITLAVGLAILMHSRPWEGAVLAVEIFAVLAWAWSKFPVDFRAKSLSAAIPAGAILLLAFGAVGYVDYRVTGKVTLMPHTLYDQQYVREPIFAFLPLKPEPVYRQAAIRTEFDDVSRWSDSHYDAVNAMLGKASYIYDFFFGFWPLLIPPLVWPYRLRIMEEQVTVLLLLGFLILAVFPISVFELHYAAPIAGLLMLRFLQTLSRLSDWRPRGIPLGPMIGVFFATFFLYQFAGNVSALLRYGAGSLPLARERNAIVQQLDGKPGQQLVFVRYSSTHDGLNEWVWNRADIDKSHTVWARAMDSAQDAELLRYYPDRHAWLLEPDQDPIKLVPYPAAP
jgi:hypothetical protein